MILEAAALEFSIRGLQGARLEAIAAQARITRAMIYYYYGGREGLYIATLEDAYRRIRDSERALDIRDVEPIEAMKKFARFRIDYYVANPVMVALLGIENQQKAAYLRNSKEIRERADLSLEPLKTALVQGQAMGLFRIPARLRVKAPATSRE